MSQAEDDKDVLAAEYVLGTLDADDRANAQMLLQIDPGFAATVTKWERKLGELNAMVGSVEPPASTWDRVRQKISGVDPSAQMWLPGVEPPPAPPPLVIDRSGEVIVLQRRVRRWRGIGLMVGTLAAAFAALVVAREIRPDLLPEQLRPPVREIVKTVEIVAPRPAQFVAVLQKDAFSPAFVLTFDLDTKQVTARTVGAERQSGRSYELWLVSNRYPAPRSLGLVGTEEYTVQQKLAGFDAATINQATYAISLEPEGGSPTGTPTGPVLYTGKLIQTTPPGFPSQSP